MALLLIKTNFEDSKWASFDKGNLNAHVKLIKPIEVVYKRETSSVVQASRSSITADQTRDLISRKQRCKGPSRKMQILTRMALWSTKTLSNRTKTVKITLKMADFRLAKKRLQIPGKLTQNRQVLERPSMRNHVLIMNLSIE